MPNICTYFNDLFCLVLLTPPSSLNHSNLDPCVPFARRAADYTAHRSMPIDRALPLPKDALMDFAISGLDERVIAFSLAVVMLAAWKIGLWIGHGNLGEGRSKPSKFDDASMALMGLLLAFAFGTSIAKYDQRRVAVVTDSNAIGDFYTCASMLNEPTRTQLHSVLRQYTQLRLDVSRGSDSNPSIDIALSKFFEMHQQMVELVRQAVAGGTPISVSLVNTLNAVTSSQVSRLATLRDRLPTSIVILLFASAIVTTLLIGREQGNRDSNDVAGTLCFILLVSIAVYVTLDLNAPGRGLIRASQEPIERLLASMQK